MTLRGVFPRLSSRQSQNPVALYAKGVTKDNKKQGIAVSFDSYPELIIFILLIVPR